MRYIHLPALNRSVTVGQYVTAIKLAKKNPRAEFKHGIDCWWPCIGYDILNQFRAGLHNRINQAIPYIKRGEKR